MNTITHIMELDLYTTTSYPVIKAQQFDWETRTLRVLLKDHEEPYILSEGSSVYLIGDRPEDGNPQGRSFLIEASSIQQDPAIVTFDITQAITRAGIVEAKVRITERNYETEEDVLKLDSILLYIDVSRQVADEASMTVEEISIVQELINEVSAITGTLNTHINDNIRHITQAEHERLTALRNVIYSPTEPSSQQEGDSWLQEYT